MQEPNYVTLLPSRLHQSPALCIHSLGFDERFCNVFKRFFKILQVFKRFFFNVIASMVFTNQLHCASGAI